MKILFRTWAIPAVLVLALIVPAIGQTLDTSKGVAGYTGAIEPVSEAVVLKLSEVPFLRMSMRVYQRKTGGSESHWRAVFDGSMRRADDRFLLSMSSNSFEIDGRALVTKAPVLQYEAHINSRGETADIVARFPGLEEISARVPTPDSREYRQLVESLSKNLFYYSDKPLSQGSSLAQFEALGEQIRETVRQGYFAHMPDNQFARSFVRGVASARVVGQSVIESRRQLVVKLEGDFELRDGPLFFKLRSRGRGNQQEINFDALYGDRAF